MKNSKDVRLLVVGLLLLGSAVPVFARLTGTNPVGSSSDAFCVGSSGNEACVDYQGNVIPTTTDDTSLGTSAMEWNQAYVKTLSLGSGGAPNAASYGTAGSINAAGTVSVAPLNITHLGAHVFGKVSITNIAGSTTIPVLSSYLLISSTGAAASVDITATPSIATTTILGGATGLTSGTYLILTSTTSSGVVLRDEGSLTGTRLQLGAASRTVSQFKTLVLVFDAADSFWREISFGNN